MIPSSNDPTPVPPPSDIVNPDRAAHPRQQALTGALRCYYDDPRHRQLRPHCQGVAVVAYGATRLCATCDAMRSSVGKGTVPRPVPAAELGRLIDELPPVQRTGWLW